MRERYAGPARPRTANQKHLKRIRISRAFAYVVEILSKQSELLGNTSGRLQKVRGLRKRQQKGYSRSVCGVCGICAVPGLRTSSSRSCWFYFHDLSRCRRSRLTPKSRHGRWIDDPVERVSVHILPRSLLILSKHPAILCLQ
jgi:hypothetical protein